MLVYAIVVFYFLCDKLVVFSGYFTVSSTNETDRHDITEILLKVSLNTITGTLTLNCLTVHYQLWKPMLLIGYPNVYDIKTKYT